MRTEYWSTLYLFTFTIAIVITNILIFLDASILVWAFVGAVVLGFWFWWFTNFGDDVQYFQLAVPPIFLAGCLLSLFG